MSSSRWALHVRALLSVAARPSFEQWLIAQNRTGATGFLGCTVLRAQQDPRVYFEQTLWDAPASASDTLWDAPASASDYAGQTALGFLEPPLAEVCDVVFDERSQPSVDADTSHPWTFHVTVRVKPGGGATYERWKVAEGVGQRAARGFIKRTLLRSRANPNVYYYQSFWESQAWSHSYSQSPAFTVPFAELDPNPVFAEPMLRQDCDIVLDVAAPAPPVP
jgi:heme-degrading monooxygenase HmoA